MIRNMKTITALLLLPLIASAEFLIESTSPWPKAHPASAVADGNPDTYFQSFRKPYANDFIVIRLGAPQKLTRVAVVTGKPEVGGVLEAGALELSKDGKVFDLSIPLVNGAAQWTGKGVEIAAVRVRATADATNTIAIREIELEDEVLTKVSVAVPGKSSLGNLAVKCNFSQVPPKLAVRLRAELDRVAAWFFEYYPKIVTRIDAPTDTVARSIEVRFRDDMKPGVPGYAQGSTMTVSIPFLLNDPGEVRGMYIHELTHVAQAYPGGNKPGWLVEGIAEAVRYQLSPPDDTWRTEVDALDPAKLDYKKSYRDTAPFLLHIEKQKPGSLAKFSRAMKDIKYTDALWPELTGKTPDEWLTEIRATKK